MEKLLQPVNGREVLSKNGKFRYKVTLKIPASVTIGHTGRCFVNLPFAQIKSVYEASCRGEKVNTQTIPLLRGTHAADHGDSALYALVLAMRDSSRIR
jgi:hypothetical protein